MTLANNEITHLKPTTVASLLAGSIGVGLAGIACFGNLTVGIGGLGTLYANVGLESTTATITGIATIGALTVNQEITRAGVLNLTTTGLANHIQFDGTGRITLNQTNTTLHGKVAAGPLSASSIAAGGAMTASSVTAVNAVTCGSLTTDAVYLLMPGLSSNIVVNGTTRFSFTQLKTQSVGDLEVTGNLTANGGGSGSVDLSDYQKHARAHLSAVGMESYYAANDASFHPNPPWDHHLAWGNFTHVCNNVAPHRGG